MLVYPGLNSKIYFPPLVFVFLLLNHASEVHCGCACGVQSICIANNVSKQVGCDPADHKKWGGACAATCIEVEPNVVRAIRGGLRSLCTPLLLFNHF